MKCHFHPRGNAVAVCSVCGIALCKRCMIEDGGNVYCDGCYASSSVDDDDDLVRVEQAADSEDYIDIELMDLLDGDDDEGLF